MNRYKCLRLRRCISQLELIRVWCSVKNNVRTISPALRRRATLSRRRCESRLRRECDARALADDYRLLRTVWLRVSPRTVVVEFLRLRTVRTLARACQLDFIVLSPRVCASHLRNCVASRVCARVDLLAFAPRARNARIERNVFVVRRKRIPYAVCSHMCAHAAGADAITPLASTRRRRRFRLTS